MNSMDQPHEELLAIADAMDELVERARQLDVQEPLGRLEDAAKEIGKSFSGSWLGYHANVYYKDLQPPPPGAHFSRTHGLLKRASNQTTGDWLEFGPDTIEAAIYAHAGHPDITASERLRVDAVREFDTWKLTALSVIESAGSSDIFLARLRGSVEELPILHNSELINAGQPSGQLPSVDMVAAGQGLWTPPHISVLARVHAVQCAFAAVARLESSPARPARISRAGSVRRDVPRLSGPTSSSATAVAGLARAEGLPPRPTAPPRRRVQPGAGCRRDQH